MRKIIRVRNIRARVEVIEDPLVALRETTGEERVSNFWETRTPCWQMNHCPPQIYEDCPAYRNRSLACWEIEGTYCKLTMEGGHASGRDTTICQVCRVYKKYGAGKPIQIRLTGAGIDAALNAVLEKAEMRA